MFQRSATVLFIFFLIAFGLMVQAAPTNQYSDPQVTKSTAGTDKQGDGLVRTIGWGFLGIKEGVKSTMGGIQSPTVPGTKEDIEKSAINAGMQVGSAIGNAVKTGSLI